MPNKDKSELDQKQKDLLERAKNLQLKTEQAPQERPANRNHFLAGWISKLKKSNPTKTRFLTFLLASYQQLKKGITWAAFEHKDGKLSLDENGQSTFSKKRLALITASIFGTLFALHAALSALYYYSTKFTETVYITGKQEIITGELYQFGGCTSLPCSTASDNGKFYLIESSFYFPRLYYPEQNVFANIPTQSGAACEVEGYGIYFRRLRWLYKSAQLYQHITSVSCRPYNQEELDKLNQ